MTKYQTSISNFKKDLKEILMNYLFSPSTEEVKIQIREDIESTLKNNGLYPGTISISETEHNLDVNVHLHKSVICAVVSLTPVQISELQK